jgi:RimJ/RimL family protein N-acetyltransferase
MPISDQAAGVERMPFKGTPRLATARLVLRPVRANDTPAIQRAFSQWEVVKHLDGGVPWPYPPGEAERDMGATLRLMALGKKSRWAIVPRDRGDDLVGCIELRIDDGVSRDQRALWLDPTYWRRGLMSEAADRVTDYALIELGWPRLWMSSAEDNLSSSRLKERQGATIVDRAPHQFVSGPGVNLTWLLTREAWLARRHSSP